MPNLTAEERNCIDVPMDARWQSCGGCDSYFFPLVDTICADQGDGSAMVNLVCPNENCGCESAFYWTLSEEGYRAVFGHNFDECDEGEDDEGDY